MESFPLFSVGSLSSGEITDSLRVESAMKLAGDKGEVDNIGDCGNKYRRTSLRNQVGMGSESDCLFGQLDSDVCGLFFLESEMI